MSEKKEMKFEDAVRELEKKINALEKGELDLEVVLKTTKKLVKLYNNLTLSYSKL